MTKFADHEPMIPWTNTVYVLCPCNDQHCRQVHADDQVLDERFDFRYLDDNEVICASADLADVIFELHESHEAETITVGQVEVRDLGTGDTLDATEALARFPKPVFA